MSSWVVVTGSNTGIGFATALGLAKKGVSIILACRSKEKGLAAKSVIEAELKAITTPKQVEVLFLPLDLSKLSSVKQFAEEILSRKDLHLQGLVNNAGIPSGGITKDNLELIWQVNYLGHYLLTMLLLPRLQAYKETHGQKARVVNLSSFLHRFGKTTWSHHAVTTLSSSYPTSKLAMMMFSYELHRQYGENLVVVCANPGYVNSDIWRDFPVVIQKLHELMCLTTEQGAACSIHAIVGDNVKGGEFYTPYWVPDVPVIGLPFEAIGPFMGPMLTKSRPWTLDQHAWESLMEVSRESVREYTH